MTLSNINKLKSEKGFTIVELLIVIVIIGILAAITIVAYNGITQRANTSSAQSAASNAVAKSEAYNAETGGYPITGGALIGATSDKTYQLTGVTFNATLLSSANLPAKPNDINFISCGAGIGTKIGYWDYVGKAITYVYSGSATASNCTGTTPA